MMVTLTNILLNSRVIALPLSPKEVGRDQHIMKKKRESQKSHHELVNPFGGKNNGFEDVFPADMPSGLPPLRGIEHQIDFIHNSGNIPYKSSRIPCQPSRKQ
jgi:hypothetical protein